MEPQLSPWGAPLAGESGRLVRHALLMHDLVKAVPAVRRPCGVADSVVEQLFDAWALTRAMPCCGVEEHFDQNGVPHHWDDLSEEFRAATVENIAGFDRWLDSKLSEAVQDWSALENPYPWANLVDESATMASHWAVGPRCNQFVFAPATVCRYLQRYGLPTAELASFEPPDGWNPSLVRATSALWSPGTDGPGADFRSAVQMAALVV